MSSSISMIDRYKFDNLYKVKKYNENYHGCDAGFQYRA